jgi:hypothetical protein
MPIKTILARRDARRNARRWGSKTQLTSKLVIRKPVSPRTRLFWSGLIGLAAGLLGVGLFVAGQYSVGFDSLGVKLNLRDLKSENETLTQRNSELTSAIGTVSTQLRIEQGARQAMEKQLAQLQDDRERLQRDLALFDNLFPSKGVDGRPDIRVFQIEPDGPDAWRYRLLIMRPGKEETDFKGEFRMEARYRLDGRELVARSAAEGKLAETLFFQRYQRLEGRFQAPAGAKLLGATARVVENGKSVAESAYRL